MSSKSRSWRSLVVLFGLLVVSVVAAERLSKRYETANLTVAGLQSQRDAALQEGERLKRRVSTTKSDPIPINTVLAGIAHSLREAKLTHRVVVHTIMSGEALGSGTRLVSEMTTPVPEAPSVRKATLNIKGRYSDYEQFKSFLGDFKNLPVGVTKLKVEGNNFEAQLALYGV